VDHKKRMELYKRAELILIEEAPLFPLFYFQWILLQKPWLSHLPFTSHQLFLTKDVVIDPH
jgi:ABC-type oligopeptide transport system substrate-binding subunit